MLKENILRIAILSLVFSVVMSIDKAYSEDEGTLQLEIKYTNGDRIDAYQTKYVVFQDSDKTPFLEKVMKTNPESISLPNNHRYKVEVYVNGMFSEVGYTELKNTEKLDVTIPLPGGIKFNVYYEDGETPLQNAKVIIKSHDGQQQRIGNTDSNGETLRYWLQSTSLPDDHYIVDVYLDNFMLTSVPNVKIHQGVAQDQKITVPIPSVVEKLITFNLYDTDSNKLLKEDGQFSVLLSDENDSKFVSHITGPNGEIYFSSIPSGVYSTEVLNNDVKDNLWNATKIIISGKQNEFQLIQRNPIQPVPEPKSETNINLDNETLVKNQKEQKSDPIVYQPSLKNFRLTCNCVSFRLDGVQDYWLNDVQLKLLDFFSQNNVPVTAGVIIDSFGEDSAIVEKVKSGIKSNNIEIANHGLDSTPFTVFDKEKQDAILKDSTNKIYQKLNVHTSIFIPPENRFNDDTVSALINNDYTHLSASLLNDSPPFPLNDTSLYRYPETATTGEYVASQNRILGVSENATFSKIRDSINKYGFAVVTIHPQEFSVFEGGQYTNKIDSNQLQELGALLEQIKNQNIRLVHLGQIDKNVSVQVFENQKNLLEPYSIPSWIKNSAGWWRDGLVDDDSFLQGIQYLINQGILEIPPTTQGLVGSEIPGWIKENAGWWAEGKISDNDFIYGVNYLVNHGIIIIDI